MRVIPIIVVTFFVSSTWAYPALNAEEVSSLNKGEVVLRTLKPSGDAGVSVRAFGIVDASPIRVWPVVRDCQHFKDFMPRTMKSELIRREGSTAICFFQIDMPFPFDDLWSKVRSKEVIASDGTYSRAWTLLEGAYRKNNGEWLVKPWGTNKTLLVYFIDIDPKIKIPDFIIRKAQTGKLPEVFDAVGRRVKELR